MCATVAFVRLAEYRYADRAAKIERSLALSAVCPSCNGQRQNGRGPDKRSLVDVVIPGCARVLQS